MKIYQVFHSYDVDGGFGDAVGRTDLLETFAGKEDAEKFVEKYRNVHVYDIPYAELYCGDLYIKEIDIVPAGGFNDKAINAIGFWWLEDSVRYENYTPEILVKVEDLISAYETRDLYTILAKDLKNKWEIRITYNGMIADICDEGWNEFEYNKETCEEIYRNLLIKHFGKDFEKYYKED